MSKLNGKVALVTGASKGIGAAIAQRLAADGASVVVNYASSKEGADKVVLPSHRRAARLSRRRAMFPRRATPRPSSTARSRASAVSTFW